MKATIKFKRLSEDATIPSKAHVSDAGFDLTATSMKFDTEGNIVYGTGIAVEIPQGFVGKLYQRSSIAKRNIMLTNCVGIIDSGYRGEILAKFKPLNEYDRVKLKGVTNVVKPYIVGEKIAQLIIEALPEVELIEVEELSESDRGQGGYGSSGN